MKNICFITSSRADFGLLLPIMKLVQKAPRLKLTTIATGNHFNKDQGNTYKDILKEGIDITKRVPLTMQNQSNKQVAAALSESILLISKALDNIKPDLVILLGDRFEIFGAAQASMILNIPIAHISGGDIGEGTYDNFIRHAITKLSSLHFVTHHEARIRVHQLGENPERIFNVGSTCVENIYSTELFTKEELSKRLKINFEKKIFVCTYHPLTINKYNWKEEFNNMISVLEKIRDVSIIFTKANSDEGGNHINKELEKFCKKHKNFFLFDSLGHRQYLSLVKNANLLVGNSSSGIYEAPYLKTPTVDIGARQRSRLAPQCVLRSDGSKNSIKESIETAENFNFVGIKNLYGDGNTSRKIIDVVKKISNYKSLIDEKFFDIQFKL